MGSLRRGGDGTAARPADPLPDRLVPLGDPAMTWRIASRREDERALLAQAPTPLQESFIQRFQALENWEQGLLLSSLQRISAMMNADGIDAAPVLSVRPLTEERA